MASNKGCFQKGIVPWNKGKKGYIGANKTSFKKGNLPHNTMPIYSERVVKGGYIEIKIDNRNKWIGKHVWIYEQHHNIKVPNGYVVIFKDGNKRNFDIDNLVMISRQEHARLNKQGGAKQPRELKDSYILLIRLEEKIRRHK